jgi:hypothetical protein
VIVDKVEVAVKQADISRAAYERVRPWLDTPARRPVVGVSS